MVQRLGADHDENGEVKKLIGFPSEWAGQFGLSAFEQFNSVRLPDEDLLGLDAPGQPVDLHELPRYTHDDVAAIVKEIAETVEKASPVIQTENTEEVK